MKFILFLLLLPLPALANLFGTPSEFGVHTLTRHDPCLGANDINFGAYIRTDKNFLLGGYYNSWRRMAYYVGYTSDEWSRFRVSAVGVTGYFAPVTFVIIPSFRVYSFDNGPSVYLSGSPVKLTEDGQSVMHVTVEWKL